METEWKSVKSRSQSESRAIRPKQQLLRSKFQSRKRSIERASESGLSKQSSTKCETVNSSQNNCKYSPHALLHIPIRIDDVTTYALVDTGASVSAMSKYFFDRLRDHVKLNVVNNNDKLRSICGSSMDIAGIYDLNVSLDNSSDATAQRFYIIPALTETCILGIDFITKNAMIIDGEIRRVTCSINNKHFSFMGETRVTEYNCSALIQTLNAVVATSDDDRANSEHLLNSPNICAKIEDVNSEKYRNMINELVEKNKDVIANKLCELGKAHGIKHKITTTGKVVYKRPRRQARANLETIDEEVDEMLKYEIIRPSSSPYSSPPHLTDKKDGGKR